MGSKRSVPSRCHSLSTYEVMFAALFAILVVLCVGLIAVAWLSIRGSERGKSYRPGYRKVLSDECIHFNLQNPASILYALLCFHGKVFILHPDASQQFTSQNFFNMIYNLDFNSEFKHETKFLKQKMIMFSVPTYNKVGSQPVGLF